MPSGRAIERNHQGAPGTVRDGKLAGFQLEGAARDVRDRARTRGEIHRRALQTVTDVLIGQGVLPPGARPAADGSVLGWDGTRVNLNEIAKGRLR